MNVWIFTTFAILVTGLLTGNELCVVFIHAALYSLSPNVHAPVAKKIAKLMGAIMPPFYVAALLLNLAALIFSGISGGKPFFWIASSCLITASILFTFVGPLPINNRIANLDLDHLPENWLEERRKWDVLHGIRVAVLVMAFLAAIVAVKCALP